MLRVLYILLCFMPAFAIAQTNNKVEVFSNPEIMPEPNYNIYKYIAEHITYPTIDSGVIGSRIVIQFIVTSTGDIDSVVAIKKISPAIDEEFICVIKSMPKWKPGRLGDKNVNVTIRLPIYIHLE